MNKMIDPYGLSYRPMMSDAEDIDTQSVVNRMNANQAYEQSPFGRINAMLNKQTDGLEGSSSFNPINMMLEGAKSANKWLGAMQYPEQVQTSDMLTPLGLGAMTAPFTRLRTGAARAAAEAPVHTTPGADYRIDNAMAEPQGIRAYHGSPHDFDRFDLSKLGTGEGVQAFGRGLYFTENEAAARNYRTPARGGAGVRVGGDAFDERNPVHRASEWLERVGHGNIENATDALQRHIASLRKSTGEDSPYWNPVLNILKSEQDIPKLTREGRTYEVNINAKPEDFADWDKISAGMRDRLRSGEGVQELRDKGVPGIRYLDQGLPGSRTSAYNYAVFDDSLIEILRKYGLIPGAVTGGAALAGGSGEAEAGP